MFLFLKNLLIFLFSSQERAVFLLTTSFTSECMWQSWTTSSTLASVLLLTGAWRNQPFFFFSLMFLFSHMKPQSCFIINIIFHYSNVYKLYCNDNIFLSLLIICVGKNLKQHVLSALEGAEKMKYANLWALAQKEDLESRDDSML